MIDNYLSHEDVMDALIQPNSLPLTDTRVTCLYIRETSNDYDDDDDDEKELQKIAESLRDTYNTSHRHLQGRRRRRSTSIRKITCSDFKRSKLMTQTPHHTHGVLTDEIQSASDLQGNSSIESAQPGHIDDNFLAPQKSKIDHATLMTPSTLHLKESEIIHTNSKDMNEKFVEVLRSNEQDDSKIALLKSIMDNMLATLQSNSTQDDSNRFDLGLKYLGQILKDTNLTSLTLRDTEISNDLLFEFAKHLPGTRIVFLELPKIVDNSWEIIREDHAICSIDSSHVYCQHLDTSEKCNKKPKTASVDSTPNEKVHRNGLEYLATILKDTQINYLDFGGNPVNLEILSCSLIDTKITSLGLSGCNIQKDGLNCLARILKDTQITSIDLSDNELDCESLKIFAPCLEGTKITCLNLRTNIIGVDGLNCLGSVLKHTEITSIDMSDNNLSWKSLKNFATCLVGSKIASLYLGGNNIEIDGMNYLGHVLKDSLITKIDISDNNLDCESLKAFVPCLVGSKIASLDLSRNNIAIDGMNRLAHVLKNTEITSIDIGYNNLNCESLKAFAPCLVGSKIASLNLSGNNIDIDGMNYLGHVLKDSQITTIDISDNNLDCESLKAFSPCLVGSKITSLNLSGNNLDIDGMNCLGHVLKDSQITTIDISDISVNNLDCESLMAFLPCLVVSKITSLNMSGNLVSYDGIKSLISVLRNTPITELNLEDCFLECIDLKSLVMCLSDTNISILNLNGNNICCNYFYLASVLEHTQIISLNLDCHRSNDPISLFKILNSKDTSLHINKEYICIFSFCFLAHILNNSKITALHISNNEIEHEGLKYLFQGLLGSGSQIDELDLSDNEIDCTDAHCLAQVLRQTRITSLNLADNKLSCEGVKYLAQGLEGSQISSLDLSNNSIKDEGINYLAESIVRTKIVQLDLRGNANGSEAASELFKSIGKSKVNSLHVQIDIEENALSASWNLFKYSNCSIEINKPQLKEGVGHLINNAYKKNGITKLVLIGDDFPHLADAFNNININEAVFLFEYDEIEDTTSILENSNIAKLKMSLKQISSNSFAKMKVIALHLQFDPCSGVNIFVDNLVSSLVYSNIVYLDLSNNKIGDLYFVFEDLVGVLGYSKIISLNLSNNDMNAVCVKLLAKVLPHTKITYIDLHGNKIGYVGFELLRNIIDKTSICWLSLGNNNIENESRKKYIELSPYIVERNYTPVEFKIRYFFRELVSLNTSSQQFEFVMLREDSVLTIDHYPHLVKHFLETPSHNIHIYDYFYMQTKRHDIHLLNKINAFIEEIEQKFISFFVNNLMRLQEKYGYDSFLSLVKVCENLKLTDSVEFLLLHRVLYYVDDENNFLHPFIYRMLHKYQMPLYNEVMEPNKKQQIISYFEKHSDIDGAQEIIDLLVSDKLKGNLG